MEFIATVFLYYVFSGALAGIIHEKGPVPPPVVPKGRVARELLNPERHDAPRKGILGSTLAPPVGPGSVVPNVAPVLPAHMVLLADQPVEDFNERRSSGIEESGRGQPMSSKFIAHDLTHDNERDTEIINTNAPAQKQHLVKEDVPTEGKNQTIVWNLSIAPVPERVLLTVKRGDEKIYDAEYNKAEHLVKVDGERRAVEKCFWYYGSDTVGSANTPVNKEKEQVLAGGTIPRGANANVLPMRYTESRNPRRKNGHPRVRVVEHVEVPGPPPHGAEQLKMWEGMAEQTSGERKGQRLPLKSLDNAHSTPTGSQGNLPMTHVGKVGSEGNIYWAPKQSGGLRHGDEHNIHRHHAESSEEVPHVHLPIYFSNVQRRRKAT